MTAACPWCGKNAMGLWRKLNLGWARKVACEQCGQLVSVPFWAFLGPMVLLVGMLTIDQAVHPSSATRVAMVAIAVAVIAVVQRTAPLVRR